MKVAGLVARAPHRVKSARLSISGCSQLQKRRDAFALAKCRDGFCLMKMRTDHTNVHVAFMSLNAD
jgi:hypothetical protein